jgi:hypothetical protein
LLIKRILTLSVILLFIGVGIQSVYAEREKEVISESTLNPDETYKNFRCFVVGRTNYTQKTIFFWNFPLVIYSVIGFGIEYCNYDTKYPAYGWVYTKGSRGEWFYEGKIWGQLYPADANPIGGNIYDDIPYTHVGIEQFRGICIRGRLPMRGFNATFIGWASQVHIGPKRS